MSKILQKWQLLSRLPGGKLLFSRALDFVVPYSGSIGASIVELRPGFCRTTVKDRRKLRNHLRSVHAVALMNFCELTSGLAVVCALPVTVRGLVTRFEIQFLKKARGKLFCECRCVVPEVSGAIDYLVEALVTDSEKTEVCRAQVTWRLDLRPT